MQTKAKHPLQSTPWRPHPLLAAFAALFLAGCGNGEEAERPTGPAPERHDLQPHWEVGQVFEIREELQHREGRGKVPPTLEVDGRSRVRSDLTETYREEVLAAEGSRLIRTQRTYQSSTVTENGSESASPVSGKTYEIQDPFGEPRVEVVLEDGTKGDASDGEKQHLAQATLRMALTLLPSQPAAEGKPWIPRRNRNAFAPIGSGQIRMNGRLKEVRTEGDRRIADLEGITEATVQRDEEAGLHLNVREEMRMDLDARMIASYRWVAELFYPPPLNPRGRWSRTVRTLTVTPR